MSFFLHLLDLMYPRLCAVCGEVLVKHEQQLCLACLNHLPQTGFHLLPGNELEQRLWGRAEIDAGTAFLYYEKGGAVQQVLFRLKYHGVKELGMVLGRHAGAALREGWPPARTADCLMPVPLHPHKLAVRGYNQSEWIARGLAEALDKPVDTTHLLRTKDSGSQTKMTPWERSLNAEGAFCLHRGHELAGRHVLLVDDVLTTGATVEECVRALHTVPGVTVSVFALAMAR